MVNLENEYNTYINNLSGGQKHKISLMISILNNPKVLFLDEPTVGLDIKSIEILWDIIKKIRDNGTTVVLSTHYLQEIESLCEKILILKDGMIEVEGSVESILANYKYMKKITFNMSCESERAKKIFDIITSLKNINYDIYETDSSFSIQTNNYYDIINILKEHSIVGDENCYEFTISDINLEDVFLNHTGG